jgi:hypothetical protein
MNRTTTVIVALIAAAGLSTMVYAVPEQRALAWGGGFGFGGFGGCGGWFFGLPIFKHIIQTTNQVNTCHGYGGEDNAQWSGGDHGDENQKDKQTVCLNTAVNTVGHDFGGVGSDLGSDGLNH